MFNRRPPQKTGLDDAITDALAELKGFSPTEEGYTVAVATVETLYKLKEIEKPERISKDTLAVVIGNLLGIAVIVGHERAHLVTSKALSFVLKSR